MSVVVVVGNPKPKSRTLSAASLVAEKVAGRPADTVIDLVDFGADLLDWSSADVAAAVEQEPNSWKAWFNLACMYDAGGERKRARAAMRNAWALRSGGQAKGMR